MNMKRALFLIAVVGCLTLSGQRAWADAEWTNYGPILDLTTTTTRFAVKIALPSNPSECKDKQWFYRDYSRAGSDNMFDMLLAAVTSGKAVQVHVTNICDVKGKSEISAVSIMP